MRPVCSGAFGDADVLFLNDIYSSAREQNDTGFSGERLRDAIAAHHRDVRYVPDFAEATARICDELRPGDIFVTMGAGDNFRIAASVAAGLRAEKEDG